MRLKRFRLWILPLFFLNFLLAGCGAQKKLTVGAAATLVDEIAKSSAKQSDLRVIRQGMPAYLLLMDGMVEAVPDNAQLLLGAARAYAAYAAAFVQDQDKSYARVLYTRARFYALRAIEQRGFKNPLTRSFDDFEKGLQDLDKNDVAYLFWTASTWGNWIALNLDSMEALAELPRVEAMMKRVLVLDEGFYYGGPHLFMAILYASRPRIAGGNLKAARQHFLRAIELGGGKFLMADVYYADYYARKTFDRQLYISILEKVLKTPADIQPDLTLLNTVAHQKAAQMLKRVDEYF